MQKVFNRGSLKRTESQDFTRENRRSNMKQATNSGFAMHRRMNSNTVASNRSIEKFGTSELESKQVTGESLLFDAVLGSQRKSDSRLSKAISRILKK